MVRLTGVPEDIVRQQRAEIEQIMVALEPYEDLLPRLGDAALARLVEHEPITIEFWRRCCVPPARLAPSLGEGTNPSRKTDAATPPATTNEPPPEEDDDDDVFVLTIDEEEPKNSASQNEGAEDSMDWSDL